LSNQDPVISRLSKRTGLDLNYYFRGGGLLFLDFGLLTLLSLLTTYCFTNYSTKDIYGSYSYIQSIVGIVMLFSLPGMANAILRSASRGYDGALFVGVRLRLKFSLIGSVVLLLASGVFHLRGQGDIALGTLVASALFPALFSFTDFRSYLQGRQLFGRYALYGFLNTFISTAATVAAILLLDHYVLILSANLIARGLSNLLLLAATRPITRNREVDEGFVGFGRNLSLLAILGSVVYYIDHLVVGTYFSMAALAAYKLAFVLSEPIRTLGVFINKLTFPRMARTRGRKTFLHFRRRLPLVILGLIPVGIVAELVVPLVVTWLFPLYPESIPLARWMIASALSAVLLIYMETFLVSQEPLHRMFYTQTVIRQSLFIVLLFVLIKPFGPLGAIWAKLAVRLGNALILLVRIYAFRGTEAKVEADEAADPNAAPWPDSVDRTIKPPED